MSNLKDRISQISMSELIAVNKMFECADFTDRYRGDWYGIEELKLMWNGTQSDPTILYKGKECSCYIMEDTMWERYNEECEENGIKPDENEGFGNYMRENKDEVIYLTELALGLVEAG